MATPAVNGQSDAATVGPQFTPGISASKALLERDEGAEQTEQGS